MAPMPSSVQATGICVFSAKATRSSQASAWRTPWPARMTGRFAAAISAAASLSWRPWPSRFGRKPGSPAMTSASVGCCGARLLLERVLGDVDVDGAGPAGAGDVERLGDDARQLVGVADQVVVLGHRQRDAVDVDLLEGVLADQRATGTLPVIATIGTESRRAVPIPVTRLVAPGPGGAHADARPGRSPGRSRRRRGRRPARGGRGCGAARGSRPGRRRAAGSPRPGS